MTRYSRHRSSHEGIAVITVIVVGYFLSYFCPVRLVGLSCRVPDRTLETRPVGQGLLKTPATLSRDGTARGLHLSSVVQLFDDSSLPEPTLLELLTYLPWSLFTAKQSSVDKLGAALGHAAVAAAPIKAAWTGCNSAKSRPQRACTACQAYARGAKTGDERGLAATLASVRPRA